MDGGFKSAAPCIRASGMLLGVTSPVLAPRIGAAQDVEERMLQRGEGCFFRGAALHPLERCSFPDIWSRKKIMAIPSRKPEVSAGHWNDVYAPTVDKSRLKWPRQETVVMLEVAREPRGGTYMTIDEVAMLVEEPVESLVNNQVFYQAGDLPIPARPDSEVYMRQGPSGLGPKSDDAGKKRRCEQRKSRRG